MKKLKWLGSSLNDLKEFPDEVRRSMGYALHLAQKGERSGHVKTLSGMGNAKILEIRERDESGIYRTMYTVEYDGYVFVLHAFQKKSKKGIATSREDLHLLKRRLKDAEFLYKELEG